MNHNESSKNKNLPTVRKAKDLNILFPSNDLLEEKEQNLIKKSVNEGGLVSDKGRCYIDSKKLPKLLVTDKGGAAKIYNNAQEDDKYENGNTQYLATSEIKKNIDERIQEPRCTLEHEKLKYSERCIDAFRDSIDLVTERHIEADRIAHDRPLLTNKKIKADNITECQLSGEAFENDARGHHVDRVEDNPRKARDLDNIVVVKDKVHQDIHNKGAESSKKLKKYINENNYNMPPNLK
ncbi:MAG: hypothetical protein RSD77_07555 [Romboutsia sp.]